MTHKDLWQPRVGEPWDGTPSVCDGTGLWRAGGLSIIDYRYSTAHRGVYSTGLNTRQRRSSDGVVTCETVVSLMIEFEN